MSQPWTGASATRYCGDDVGYVIYKKVSVVVEVGVLACIQLPLGIYDGHRRSTAANSS